MAEQSTSPFATLAEQAARPEPQIDSQGRAYATGKRKNAVARVWIKPGSGKIIVNTRPVEVFFARPVLRMLIQQPLVTANRQGQYDVVCTVSGGGLSGQAGAVRHGISKALTYFEPDLRTPLKRGGWLFYLVVSACLAFSAFFEFIEWWSALAWGGAADAFLATQGDVWDTQWDMFLAFCGAMLAQLLLGRWYDRMLEGDPRPAATA